MPASLVLIYCKELPKSKFWVALQSRTPISTQQYNLLILLSNSGVQEHYEGCSR